MRERFSPTLVILIMLLVWAAISHLWSALSWGHESWQLSEWLINYSGGFVRRGLPGTIIGALSKLSGIQANHLVITFSAVIYLSLLGWFLIKATRSFPPVLLLSCVCLGFPAYQDSIIRKDCLGLLLLVLCIGINRSRWPRLFSVPALNLTAGAAILSHEAFAFYGLPALALFAQRDQVPARFMGLLRRSLVLLPACLCFLCVTIHHGTPEIAEAVNDSWLPLWRVIDPTNPHLPHPAASIQALGWTPDKGVSLGLTLLTSGMYQPTAWIILFASSFGVVLLFTGRNSDHGGENVMEARLRVSALLLIQFVFISPLFLAGYDYGRWLFLWVASSIILHTEEFAAPRWVRSCACAGFAKLRMNHIPHCLPAKDYYLLFLGIPVCWNIREFLVSSPIGRHLNVVWSWF